MRRIWPELLDSTRGFSWCKSKNYLTEAQLPFKHPPQNSLTAESKN